MVGLHKVHGRIRALAIWDLRLPHLNCFIPRQATRIVDISIPKRLMALSSRLQVSVLSSSILLNANGMNFLPPTTEHLERWT